MVPGAKKYFTTAPAPGVKLKCVINKKYGVKNIKILKRAAHIWQLLQKNANSRPPCEAGISGRRARKVQGRLRSEISFCDGINSEIEGDTSSIREVDSREIEWEDLREDCVEESLPNEKILSNVQGERGYFAVKRVVK